MNAKMAKDKFIGIGSNAPAKQMIARVGGGGWNIGGVNSTHMSGGVNSTHMSGGVNSTHMLE